MTNVLGNNLVRCGAGGDDRKPNRSKHKVRGVAPPPARESTLKLRHEMQCIVAGLLVLALIFYLIAGYLGIESNMLEKVIDNMIIILTAIAFYYFAKAYGKEKN